MLLLPASLVGQCLISQPITIGPDRTTEITLSVSDIINDQLGVNNALCAVFLEWEHGKQENLRFELISPAGQVVTLMGPGINGGGLSPLVNWNLNFVTCTQPNAPHPGIEGVWDNNQSWESFISVSYTHLTLPTKRIV